MELSILIPARNEEWLAETLHDLLRNIRAKTEIIVVLDGEQFPKELPQAPNLKYITNVVSLGQRASTNQAAREAQGAYFMKVDAHCAFDEGFDVKMLSKMEPNWTMVPIMRNLHVFDWVCPEGHRRYQGRSGPCTTCAKPTTRDIVWIPKIRPESKSYRFDHTLHFQYFREFHKRPEAQGEITETMSLQGSCFMLSRDKYWELGICDEAFGSWGQQGVEVACKTWLSGGRVVVNHTTWYAHLFRTQGGDFGFPYPITNAQVEHARQVSRALFLDNTWPLQKYPLSWLVEKFKPVPNWHDGKDEGMLAKIITHGEKMVK